jgi:hypothetical protein
MRVKKYKTGCKSTTPVRLQMIGTVEDRLQSEWVVEVPKKISADDKECLLSFSVIMNFLTTKI